VTADTTQAMGRPLWRVRPWQQGLLLFLVAFVPRALTAMQGFVHQDETRWLFRSEHYARAMLTLDFEHAASSVSGHHTMPGIPTVVVGGVARVLWGGLRDLGVVSFPEQGFTQSRAGLIIAQVLMAAATSGLLVLLWWVLTNWSTRIVATTAVLILATEPMLVADGTKLKTDSFLMLFGAIGAFALAAVLDVPAGTSARPGSRRHWVLAAVAGIGIGGAALSKLTFGTFVFFYVGLVLYACVRGRRKPEVLWSIVRTTAAILGVALLLLVVFWPAAWADPSGQLEVIRGGARLQHSGHPQFFLGDVVEEDPGPLFYFIVTPIRMTPWFLVAVVASLVVVLRRRALRGFAVVALAFTVVPFVTITFSTTKFDRYTLPLWPMFAVLVGLLVQAIATRCREQGPERVRAFQVAAAGAIAGVIVYTLLVAPYGFAYANPALGGGPVAEKVFQVGVDNATEAGDLIRDREGARCAEVRIRTRFPSALWFPCGDPTRFLDLRRGDYRVIFANRASVVPEEYLELLRANGRTVAVIQARGIDIAEVIQLLRPEKPIDSDEQLREARDRAEALRDRGHLLRG